MISPTSSILGEPYTVTEQINEGMTFNEQQQQKWNEIHQIMDAVWILQ